MPLKQILNLFNGGGEQESAKTKRRHRHALVSCISDNIIGLGATFLASLTENLRMVNKIDIIFLTNKTAIPLNTKNRELLLKINPSIQFKEVSSSFLTKENTRLDKFTKEVSNSTRQAPFLKFHIFSFEKYHSVLWMDSDMLVLHDFSELFKLPDSLCVVRSGPSCKEAYFGVAVSKKLKFNSGLLKIGPGCLKVPVYRDLAAMVDKRENFILRDQPLLNKYFLDQDKLFLPHAYNWKLLGGETGWEDDQLAASCAKIVHFVGSTKWHLLNTNSELTIAKTFHAIRNKYNIPLHFAP